MTPTLLRRLALFLATMATAPVVVFADAPPLRETSPAIVPAGAWSDQNGDLVQLHGIGLLKVGDTYWAYGQDNRDGEPFHCVATYSSKDLATWTRHEDALGFEQAGELRKQMLDDPKFVVERPKVLFNRRANRFVMFFHFDTGKRDQSTVGVATCDRPDGRFSYVGKFKPQGNRSGDMGVFVDPNNGQAYLIAEDRSQVNAPKTARTVIYQLNDDYADVRPDSSAVLPPVPTKVKYPAIEAPTIVYEPTDKLYYVFGSLLTGWAHNNNVYTTTPSLIEPKWSPWRMFAEPKTDTFGSQVSFVLPVQGSEATSYVYVGDRWTSRHLWDSTPVILPMRLAGGVAALEWHDAWSIDLGKGTWRARTPIQTFEAESGALAGGAAVVRDVESSAGALVSLPTDGAAVTFTVRVKATGPQTIEIAYRNDDPIVRFGRESNRHATVSANAGPAVRLSFPVTHDRLNPVAKATATLTLTADAPDTITLTADGVGPDVDTVALYGEIR